MRSRTQTVQEFWQDASRGHSAIAGLLVNLRRCDHITEALISLHWLRVPRTGANYIQGGDADLSCTAWFRTTLLGVVIHMCRRHAVPTQAQVRLHWTAWRSDLSSLNYWSKGVEWPAKRCYVGLVAVGVQEQAEDILVSPLLQNCLTLNYIFPSHYLPSPPEQRSLQ